MVKRKTGLGDFTTKKLIFFLCLVVFLVYANSLFNGFVWDDFPAVVNNKAIQDISNLPLLFRKSVFYVEGFGGPSLTGDLYRPMTTSYLTVMYFLWGMKDLPVDKQAFVFHFFQLMIHLANVVLVFLIFKKLLSKVKFKMRQGNEGLAFLAALLWGVHPVNVESVVFVSAISDILHGFFCLSTFWLILLNKPWAFWGSIVFFLGALLSKEAALLGGCLILLYLFLFERKKFLRWLGLFVSAVGGYFYLRLGVAKIPFGLQGTAPIMEATVKERLMTIPWEFFSYLRLTFFPKVLAIAQHFVVKTTNLGNFWLPLIVDLGFLGVLGYFGWRLKSRVFWFFCAWFWLSIGMVLNIIPLDFTIAERWLYFPLIGFLGGLGYLSPVVWQKLDKKWRKRGIVLVMVVLVGLSLRTIKRNLDWRTSFILYSHDVQYSKYAWDIESNLGLEYGSQGNNEAAIKHLLRSVELKPNESANWSNLALIYKREGNFEKAEEFLIVAIENGRKRLEFGNMAHYENLVSLLFKMGKLEEGERYLREGLMKYPEGEGLNQLKRDYMSVINP